jgi:predicted 2-oxoglutarate/Fe(II)-dependent dioxygenase YbiX
MILNADPFVAEFSADIKHSIFKQIITSRTWQPSQGWDFGSNQSQSTSWRSSHTAFDHSQELNFLRDQILADIDNHTGYKYSSNCCESIQLTKYKPGDFYKPHYDNFNLPGVNAIDNDRVATAILYLNADFEGGSTVFPNLSLEIRPDPGKILFFSYPIGTNVSALIHEAAVVTSGHKYIATLWIRQHTWQRNEMI